MAVNTTSSKVIALGNGVLTVFNFGFTLRQAADVKVYYVDANGNETDVTAQCVVALNAVAAGAQWAVGGTVAYSNGGTPIPGGTQLAICRVLTEVQANQFTNQGGLFPAVTEQTADLLQMQIQQLQEAVSRTALLTIGKDQSLYTLTLNPVANALIGWDPTGKILGTVAGTGGVNLILPATPGIVVYTGGTTFISRTLTAGQGILITNGGGAAGNPIVTVQPGTQNLVDANNTAWNMNNGQVAVLTATGAVGNLRILDAPTNLITGERYMLRFIQDATGGRGITWNAVYHGVNGFGTPFQPNGVAGSETDYMFWSPDGVNLNIVSYSDESRPNLLVNPNWQIDQINVGALYTVPAAGTTQGPDGWTGTSTAAPGVFKMRTVADPDNAALKCLEITCTTIDAAIGAADAYLIYTAIEGYDAAALMAGTASALQMTIQFKFKSNVNGVHGISICNSAANRSYVGIFTVADANEHEYTLTLTMDTAGAWLYTTGTGLQVRICLAAGANYQAAAGAWNAANNLTTAAQCNFMSNVANIAYLKRIQVIPGSIVQAYKPADIPREYAKAQRYWESTYGQGVAVGTADGTGLSAYLQTAAATCTDIEICWNFKVSKRAIPAVANYSPQTGTIGKVFDAQAGVDVAAVSHSLNAEHYAFHGILTGTIGPIAQGHATANARLS